MPYQCKYCGERFCSNHHLPEAHKCKALPSRSWSTYAGERGEREPVIVEGPPTWVPAPDKRFPVHRVHKTIRKIGRVLGGIAALAIILVIGLLIWAVFIPWLGTFVETSGGESSIDVSQLEQETFNLINQERSKYGLAPVSWDDQVAEVAREHSKDMAQNDFFAHQNLEGQNVDGRLTEGGVSFFSCGEIILEQSVIESETTTWIFFIPITSTDYKTQSELAQIAVSGWMASSGHRAIILTSGFSEAGVGVWVDSDETTYYFTGDFIG